MTTIVIPLLMGLLGAAAFALLARAAPPRRRMGLHAAALVVAAVAYIVFAARDGDPTGVLVEVAGTVLFGGVAALGLARRSARLLALGWALHPLWDVVLHTRGILAGYTPPGYVVACVGFDLLLAALIASGWAGLPTVAPDRAETSPA
ncbi:MAG TPA: DUF6010 family protein [Longimicrobium sp.]|nr:DUF6010 family protein [Longimicrobium sp.]